MKAHYEKLACASRSLLAFERCEPEFPFYWHYHPEIELTLIAEGYGERLVGDSRAQFRPGDLVLLGPNLPHTWWSHRRPQVSSGMHRAVVLQFSADLFGNLLALEGMSPIAQLLERARCGLAFPQTDGVRAAAARLVKIPALSQGRRVLALLLILLELADERRAILLSTSAIRPMCQIKHQRRINKICLYLEHRDAEKINWDELSRLIHMCRASLCRFFRRATGRTMTQYLNEIRVDSAARLLVDTDLNVLDVAFRAGFGNYSNFTRQFKKIKGYGPRELRRRFCP